MKEISKYYYYFTITIIWISPTNAIILIDPKTPLPNPLFPPPLTLPLIIITKIITIIC